MLLHWLNSRGARIHFVSKTPVHRTCGFETPLSKDISDSRIMIFNHNTAWQADALNKSLKDHGNDLLRALLRDRKVIILRRQPIFTGLIRNLGP